MFAAGVAAGTGFNGHIDNAVHDGFGLLGSTKRSPIINLASGITTISDYDQHFSSLPGFKRLRSEKNCVVKSGCSAGMHMIDAAIDSF